MSLDVQSTLLGSPRVPKVDALEPSGPIHWYELQAKEDVSINVSPSQIEAFGVEIAGAVPTGLTITSVLVSAEEQPSALLTVNV